MEKSSSMCEAKHRLGFEKIFPSSIFVSLISWWHYLNYSPIWKNKIGFFSGQKSTTVFVVRIKYFRFMTALSPSTNPDLTAYDLNIFSFFSVFLWWFYFQKWFEAWTMLWEHFRKCFKACVFLSKYSILLKSFSCLASSKYHWWYNLVRNTYIAFN